MRYRVLRNGINPSTKKPIKKGQIIEVFHQIGNPLCEGKDPLLSKSKRIDPNTAIALEAAIKAEMGEMV